LFGGTGMAEQLRVHDSMVSAQHLSMTRNPMPDEPGCVVCRSEWPSTCLARDDGLCGRPVIRHML
jgi:hypothetical protein